MEQEGANIPPVKVYADKYAGQVVVITGAAGGIGEVTAVLFGAQGATVVLVDISEERLQSTQSKLIAGGTARMSYRVCDLVDETQVSNMINEVASTYGKIDVLVHLAGIYPFSPLLESTLDDYNKIMKVNMDSCFFLTHSVLPHMQKAGYGRIINTASGTVLHPEAGLALYATSKSAVAGFTRATAVEAGPGVTANTVCPGLVKVEGSPVAVAIFEKSMAKQAVKRFCLPRDVAHTINFIASPEAEFITGHLFDVSGGSTFN